ncbi:hypothetical protein BsWGS_02212 [Bradybaena similaris]
MRVGKVMPFTWCLQLLSLGLLLNVDSCCGAVQPCTHNNMTLLGSPCRYKCHCLNNKCDTNAECTESRGCEQGWFGPACQYVDLLTINATTSTPAWVYDFPDNLCNTGQDPVTISLKGTAYFTWLRLKLRANFTVSSQVFQLHLKSGVGSTVDCLNMYTSAVSDTILDIHCQPGVFFQKLDITGEGVLSLCQVYISGGRNVALGQETHQTSDYDNMFSWHAVDGATNSEYYHRSCSHTSFNDNKPTWTLTFGRPHQVNRYVLYNRNLEQQRLQGFNLEADQKNGSAAFVYTGPSISQDIYRIQSDTPHIPVSSVKVSVTYKEGNYTFLTLCEVEIFGDAVCPAGKYGKECNNSCNCAKSGENCFVSTGGCPSGCAAGYQWEGCQIPCPQKTFGQDCRETCSTNCSSQLCDTVNGKCASCVRGTTGDYCDQVCPQKRFSQNCSETCSTNCSSQLCDTVNGKCVPCVPETTGDYCDQEQLVDPPGPSPPVAAIVGPVVACVVLITLVIIGVLIWRTRRHKSDGPEETPPHKINNYAEKDSIRAEESSTATTVPDEALTAQAKSPVMKKPKSDPDGNHESNHVNGVYFNQLSEHPETVIQFGNVDNVKATHGKEFYQEHLNLMPTNSSATTTVAMSPENHKKNSYQNISLYENPRIRLPTDILKNDGDYINASLNDDFQQKKQYIASQENPYEMPMDLLASTQPAGHANYDYPVPSTDDSTTNSYMKISECVANTFEDSNDIIDNPYESVNNDTVANVYDVINDSNLNI